MYTSFVTALLAATAIATKIEGPTVADGDKPVMAAFMSAEYNAVGEGAERTLSAGNAMIFAMAPGYSVEDKVGIPYVYACIGIKDDKNQECFEARFEREADAGKKTVLGIRVKKYLIAAANATISSASQAKYASPAEYFDAAVGAKKGLAKGERETESKTTEVKFVERAGGNMEQKILEPKVTAEDGQVMVASVLATGAAVDAAITETKALAFVGTLGACYKKRGAAGADDTSLYAQKAIEFKYSEFVEPADGGDGGKGGDDDHSDHEGHDHDGEDSAFAYSMAGVVLATAALAF